MENMPSTKLRDATKAAERVAGAASWYNSAQYRKTVTSSPNCEDAPEDANHESYMRKLEARFWSVDVALRSAIAPSETESGDKVPLSARIVRIDDASGKRRPTISTIVASAARRSDWSARARLAAVAADSPCN